MRYHTGPESNRGNRNVVSLPSASANAPGPQNTSHVPMQQETEAV
jgi:hypothetical protein